MSVASSTSKPAMMIPWDRHLGISHGEELAPVNQRISQFLNIPIGRTNNGNCKWTKEARLGFNLTEFRALRVLNKDIKNALDRIVTFKDVTIVNVLGNLPVEVISLFAHASPGLTPAEGAKKRREDGFAALMQLPHFLHARNDAVLKDRDLAVAQSMDDHSIENLCFIEHGRRSLDAEGNMLPDLLPGVTLTLIQRNVRILEGSEATTTLVRRFDFLQGTLPAYHWKTNPRDEDANHRERHVPGISIIPESLEIAGLQSELIAAQLNHPKKDHVHYANAYNELLRSILQVIAFVFSILIFPIVFPFTLFYPRLGIDIFNYLYEQCCPESG